MPQAKEAKDEHGYTDQNYQQLPNKEAIISFNSKALLTTESYHDLKAYQHALAFTVAGIADEDLLKDVRNAVKSTLENGTDFRTFKRTLKPYLMAKGWLSETVPPPQSSPQGGGAESGGELTIGSNRRLRTIYSTNLQTSYAAGQWSRIQQTKVFLSYLQYMPSVSEHPRLEHKKYYHICRPADDVIWQSIFPPNGWGCKCWVKQLTKRQAEKVGISKKTLLETEEYTNPKTGEVSQVPKGIDPSFNHNFDKMTALLRLAEDKHGGEFAQQLKKKAEKLMPDTLPLPIAVSKPSVSDEVDLLPPPKEWKSVAKMGEDLMKKHNDLFDVDLKKPHAFANAVQEMLEREAVPTGATVNAIGDEIKTFQRIIERYPASWVEKANEEGVSYVRNLTGRGYQLYIADSSMAEMLKSNIEKHPKLAHLRVFKKFKDNITAGDSFLYLKNLQYADDYTYGLAIHELGHRLQAVMPELDEYFNQFWLDRTRGETTRPLAKIQSERGEIPYYQKTEVGRKDSFADVYIGRNYGDDDNPKPKEVLTMAFQSILGSGVDGASIEKFLHDDPEMIYLAMALLVRYQP